MRATCCAATQDAATQLQLLSTPYLSAQGSTARSWTGPYNRLLLGTAAALSSSHSPDSSSNINFPPALVQQVTLSFGSIQVAVSMLIHLVHKPSARRWQTAYAWGRLLPVSYLAHLLRTGHCHCTNTSLVLLQPLLHVERGHTATLEPAHSCSRVLDDSQLCPRLAR
jgi:hypothetical protein